MKTKTEQIFELSCPFDNPFQGPAARLLFVCSAGLLRSATAAKVAHELGYNARACGSEHYALIPLSANLLAWATTVYFVNSYNLLSAKETFENDPEYRSMLEHKAEVWDIEDVYNYNSPILVSIIKKLLT